jgi:hypothetical protein
MPRHLPVLLACSLLPGAIAVAEAQTRSLQPIRVVAHGVSIAAGRIEGQVRDDRGMAIQGANIVALGVTLASSLSDERGRFSLALPPGEYLLRASRLGYVSSFRQLVRVRSSVPLERNITLMRLGVAELGSPPGAAVPAQVPGTPAATAVGDEYAHNEMAWRLRHITRNVLRDAAPTHVTTDQREAADFRPPASLFDRALQQSARAATSFFTDTDFSGSINFLTTSSFAPARGWQFDQGPRGIASAVVGARVGRHGDWRVRGAMTSDALSSWVLLGEYRARDEGAHAFRVGMSYAVQGDLDDPSGSRRGLVGAHRSLGAIHMYDRWRPIDGVELDYGARIDRVDYLELQDFMSPRVTTRATVLPRTFVVAHAAQHIVVPGGSEFLPPASSTVWLPPERTFSPLLPGAPFRAERVRHAETGVGFLLDADGARTVSLRRFRQISSDQIATLFGLHTGDAPAHFAVATPGSVEINGWTVRYDGRFARRFSGTIDYALADADWRRATRQMRAVRWLAPSAARPRHERLHDLTMALSAEIPESSTQLRMAYRISSGFSRDTPEERDPSLGGRFDVELRQRLPYRLLQGSTLELVVAARSLSRDLREPGSLYDELLTVAPPMRVLGGLQVRF